MEFYVGQIIMFGGEFAIRSFSFCSGQLIAISQNSALFSILGTTYGGDGRTTFGLPDLRGRVPINAGGKASQGPGLSTYRLGQRGGAERHTLNIVEMPSHTHSAQGTANGPTLRVSNADGNADAAPGTHLARQAGEGLQGAKMYTANASSTTSISGLDIGTVQVQVGQTGGNQSFDMRQPFLAINFEIALYGIYPSRG